MKQQGKKSTVDCIITSRTIEKDSTYAIDDEDGIFRIKGRNDKGTGHRKIVTNIKVNNLGKKALNINSELEWKEFNTHVKQANQDQSFNIMNNTEVENTIIDILKNTVEKIKIQTVKGESPQSEELTRKKERKQKQCKQYNKQYHMKNRRQTHTRKGV